MSKRKCINNRPKVSSFIHATKTVVDMHYESVDSFIFEIRIIEYSGLEHFSKTILKLSIVSETKRSLPYFFKEFDDDYDADNAFLKMIMKTSFFEREKEIQQNMYTAMLPYGHFCPQVFEAGLVDPTGARPFLDTFVGTTDESIRMLNFLKENVEDDSVGYIVMEYIPSTYIQFKHFKRINTPAEILERGLYAMARLCMTFIVTGICNVDAHLGNMLTLAKDTLDVKDKDSVVFIDFGRAVYKHWYEPYHSRHIPKTTLGRHYHAKMTKKYSIQYSEENRRYTQEIDSLKILNKDTLFDAIRHYVIIDYECNWSLPKCRDLIRLLFPNCRIKDIMDRLPHNDLFSDRWFHKDESTHHLNRMVAIMYALPNASRFFAVPPIVTPSAEVSVSLVAPRKELAASVAPRKKLTASVAPRKELAASVAPQQDFTASVGLVPPSYSRPGLSDDRSPSPPRSTPTTWAARMWQHMPPTQYITFDAVKKTFMVGCAVASLAYLISGKTMRRKRKTNTHGPVYRSRRLAKRRM